MLLLVAADGQDEGPLFGDGIKCLAVLKIKSDSVL